MGILVAACRDFMAYSETGVVWEVSDTGTVPNHDWSDVVWSPELASFVAVGGTNIYHSANGRNWTVVWSGAVWYKAVCWAAALGVFVAVPLNTTSGSAKVAVSPDGVTWTLYTMGTTADFSAVCWAPDINLFVALKASSGYSSPLFTSPNGTTWTERTSAVIQQRGWSDVTWSPALAKFVAVGGQRAIATSTNGTTWTQISYVSRGFGWKSVEWVPSIARFVVAGTVGGWSPPPAPRIDYSDDGSVWVSGDISALSTVQTEARARWVADADYVLAMPTYLTSDAARSADGEVWAPTPISWGGVTGLFLNNFVWGDPPSTEPFWTNRVKTQEII